MPGCRLIRFGPFELDTYRRVLKAEGEVLAIPVPLMSALIYLVRQRDRMVPRRELRRALYRREEVDSDRALDACVGALRRLLGDAGRRPRYVATDLRVGYRFVGPLEGETPDSARSGSRAPSLRMLAPEPGPPRPAAEPLPVPRRRKRRPARPRGEPTLQPVTAPKRRSASAR